ncbi:MAG TPA: hypothetical protein P5181_07285 [Dermatophilaceae bacterium]|nr:hypothetical protein [Dermatophilaceae bacterium]
MMTTTEPALLLSPPRSGHFRPVRVSLAMLGALALGMASGGLFRWGDPSHVTDLSAWAILGHNLVVAALAVAASAYVAYPMILVNCWYLGVGLHASVIVEGWARTISFTAGHVPLEMLAWLLTVRLSWMTTALVQDRLRRRRGPSRDAWPPLARSAALVLTCYAAAAAVEWLELWLQLRKG